MRLMTLFLFLISLSSQAFIDLKVSGIKELKGTLQVAVFASSEGFPSDHHQAVYVTQEVIYDHEMTLSIASEDLVEGEYAIAVYQDVNNDGVLNRNLFGAPTEPYGFSQNPRIRLRAPRFHEASFPYPETVDVEIELK